MDSEVAKQKVEGGLSTRGACWEDVEIEEASKITCWEDVEIEPPKDKCLLLFPIIAIENSEDLTKVTIYVAPQLALFSMNRCVVIDIVQEGR